jgi:hypothetical protein
MEEPGLESSEQLIEQLTRQIGSWKLTLPALLLLEVTRPFSFIASQGLLLCQPLLSYVIPEPRIADYAELLADRASVDRLVACLENQSTGHGQGGEERG